MDCAADPYRDALEAAGCDEIFIDKGASAKLASRPELDKALARLRPGDMLVITRLSRAMRSLRHLLADPERPGNHHSGRAAPPPADNAPRHAASSAARPCNPTRLA
jgi:hypothetical protein